MSKSLSKNLLIKLSVVVVMFGIGLLPPFGEMTPLGMTIFGIFVGGVYGWIVDGLVWTSLLGIGALAATGVYDSLAACFGAVFGNTTSVLIFCACFLCAYVEYLELPKVIIGWMMNLKICKKSPYVMAYIFFLADLVVATVSNSLIAIVLFCEFYRVMIKGTDIKPGGLVNSFWVCGIAFVAAYSEMVVPFKTVAIVIMGLYTANTGEVFSSLAYCFCYIPAILLIIAVYILIGKLVFRVDFNQFKSVEVEKVPPTKKQKAGLWFTLGFLIVVLLPDTLGKISALSFLATVGTATLAILYLVFMMACQIENEPVLELQKLSAKFPWAVYLMISFSMGYASFLSSEDAGLSATLSSWLTPLLGSSSAWIFVTIMVVLAVLITNVLNNMVTLMLFVSALFVIGPDIAGLNITALFILLGIASFTACATPAASSTAALAFSQTDLISKSKQFIVGTVTVVILTVLTIVIGYPIFCMFF